MGVSTAAHSSRDRAIMPWTGSRTTVDLGTGHRRTYVRMWLGRSRASHRQSDGQAEIIPDATDTRVDASQPGQFLGRRWAGRGTSTRCWPAACQVRGTADAARELAEPWGRGALARPGVVRARSGPVVDPVTLIASAWPSRMRDCDGGLRPESRCGQTGLHPWPRRRAHGRRCARSVGCSSAGSPAQGPAGP